MQNIVKKFTEILDVTEGKLQGFDEMASGIPIAPGKWSRKEILGHLIDSASNNHGRFVRAQLAGSHADPGYEQNGWVAVQRYRDEPWSALVDLWLAYNRHLLYVITSIPPELLDRPVMIDGNPPLGLALLIEDYVAHMEHHLAQIFAPGIAEQA